MEKWVSGKDAVVPTYQRHVADAVHQSFSSLHLIKPMVFLELAYVGRYLDMDLIKLPRLVAHFDVKTHN